MLNTDNPGLGQRGNCILLGLADAFMLNFGWEREDNGARFAFCPTSLKCEGLLYILNHQYCKESHKWSPYRPIMRLRIEHIECP